MVSIAKNEPVHVCLLGPSGIGKSPLGSLFRMGGVDPKRVRDPRDEKDKRVCLSDLEADELYLDETGEKRPVPAPADWFEAGMNWLFFNVREDAQCLQFKDEKSRSPLLAPKRAEIFAPRLLDILQNRANIQAKFRLKPDNLVVLLLNPCRESYVGMSAGAIEELKRVTFYAIAKRMETQGNPVDLPDVLKRVSQIDEERDAWASIKIKVDNAFPSGSACVEITSWKHFEFRYHQPDGTVADAKRELLSARDEILPGLYEAAKTCDAVQRFLDQKVIRSSEEILKLDDIV